MNQNSQLPISQASGVASPTSPDGLDTSSEPPTTSETATLAPSVSQQASDSSNSKAPRFMPTLAEKRWDHQTELKTQQLWDEEKLYRFRINREPRFMIDTPPPYPSGRPWHIGALAHYAQIDMIARAARMMGHETFFPIGIDRNGLPVERYVETTYKIDMRSQDRQKFIDYCAHALD